MDIVGRADLEVKNTKLSDAMPSRRALRYALLLLMILIPLLWSGIIRLLMSDWELGEMLSYFKSSWEGGFWSAEYDSTFYYTVLSDNGGLLGVLLNLLGLVCFTAGIVLVYKTIKKKMKGLLPFAVPYFVFAVLMLLTVLGDMTLGGAYGRYSLLQLWGYNIRLLHGTAPVVMYSLLAAGYAMYLYLDLRPYRTDEGDKPPA